MAKSDWQIHIQTVHRVILPTLMRLQFLLQHVLTECDISKRLWQNRFDCLVFYWSFLTGHKRYFKCVIILVEMRRYLYHTSSFHYSNPNKVAVNQREKFVVYLLLDILFVTSSKETSITIYKVCHTYLKKYQPRIASIDFYLSGSGISSLISSAQRIGTWLVYSVTEVHV